MTRTETRKFLVQLFNVQTDKAQEQLVKLLDQAEASPYGTPAANYGFRHGVKVAYVIQASRYYVELDL